MSETRELVIGLLDASNELEVALGRDWPNFRDRLAALVASLDSVEREGELRRETDRLIDELLAAPAADLARRIVRTAQEHVEISTKRGGYVAYLAGSPEEQAEGFEVEKIFFRTDRQDTQYGDPESRFSGERGKPAWGVARVSIPMTHEKGRLESPEWSRFEFRQDPRKHVVLMDIATMDRARFVTSLREAVLPGSSRDAMVFVHGYNVSFANAARRTAQIKHDLRFSGRALFYSWPSKSEVLAYGSDLASIEWSTPHFEAFLRTVLTEIEAETVHVIAHSMGNRALTRALERLDPNTLPVGAAKLRQIVFAAPDVDRAVFEQLAVAFRGRADRMTLYASRNDLAMKLSRLIHSFPRAGDADRPLVVESVDTVDASAADASLFGLGHSYVANKRSILVDLYELLKSNTPPAERFGLETITSEAGEYWLFKP